MKIKHIFTAIFLVLAAFLTARPQSLQPLKIFPNGRFFKQSDGKPFFWLGDTAWLLLKKCTREETVKYLETRRKQGFNVVQIMVVHDLKEAKNAYGSPAFADSDISKPQATAGNRFGKKDEYDYWDHLDWVVDEARRRGIYAALVPIWGSNVKGGSISETQAVSYASFLAERFKNKPNIIWLNGGDIRGDDSINIWKTIGSVINEKDPNHLITFHPRGRTSSSEWFHNEKWLDFNMFQSGHRNYAQDNDPKETHRYGEDNWRYAVVDHSLTPVKPVLDGEPSYENIPQGLHDIKQPRWNDADIRRYAYWSVFAGGAGFTYGENSVMQFYTKKDRSAAYGADRNWQETLNSPGANQMRYLKTLVLSGPFFERVPAPELVVEQRARYGYIAATRGKSYAFLYTYTGGIMKIKLGVLPGKRLKCFWYNPRDGRRTFIENVENKDVKIFDPPGEEKEGNDRVLILLSV